MDIPKIKVTHWRMTNGSGLSNVSTSISLAEKALGIDSNLANPLEPDDGRFDKFLDSDVHVLHTHIPDSFRKKITKPYKFIYVCHGTPEHIFQSAVEEGVGGTYGHADGWMLSQKNIQTADATVTFWPRHQAIWKSLSDKNTIVKCIKLGVDKSFWKKTPSRGKFAGNPSLFTAENCHYIKWPLDLMILLGWIMPKLKTEGKAHFAYLPNDMSRYFHTLANRNTCSYYSHISPIAFDHENLRNVFNSVDYYVGLVRYGDFNRISLEANSCNSCKTISYVGNPYSDYHIHEGDQRIMAEELLAILNNEVEPRVKEIPCDISETALQMIELYKELLS